MSQEAVLAGESRMAWSHELRRPIRAGSLAALGTSDIEELNGYLAAGDPARSREMLDYLHNLFRGMLESYIEWIQNWHSFVATRQSVQDAQTVANRTAATYRETVDRCVIDDAAVEMVLRAVHSVCPDDAAEPPPASERGGALMSAFNRAYGAALDALQRRHFEEAASLVGQYVSWGRQYHDALVAYVGTYASSVTDTFGQPFAEEGLEKTLAACTYYEPWWQFIEALKPALRVLVLAEEFRGHFSGPGRNGSVEIVEEPDRYRLVFAPCGSGGALRRGSLGGGETATLGEPSPATWGRAGAVPAYCAHCALNERTSVARLGYPAWVTEFDPDPMRPCGWTIFKDPALIPEHYFVRIGIQKPSSFSKEPESR